MSEALIEAAPRAQSDLQELLKMRREAPMQLASLLAVRRPLRGIRWLDQHAFPGWRRNMFEPMRDGTAYFRPDNHFAESKEGVLARAFEFDASLADSEGYVTTQQVMSRFNLSLRHAAALGFVDAYYWKRNNDVRVTSQMLNVSWETHIRSTDPIGRRWAYRHETEIDRRFRTMDFLSDNNPGPLRKLLRRLRRLWPIAWTF